MTDIKKERTLVLIKPDGIQRALIGEVIKRYERTGLKLSAMKMLIPTRTQIEKHYTVDAEWLFKCGTKAINSYLERGLPAPTEHPVEIGKLTLEKLKNYMTSGPVIAMVWTGMNAIGVVRKITGSTEPLTSDVGSIRGDFTIDSYQMSDTSERSVRNLIHASSSPVEAEQEIDIWFDKHELINYRLFNEVVLYDTNLDGILE